MLSLDLARPRHLMAVSLSILGASASCNQTPLEALEFSMQVTVHAPRRAPAKVDFLWVVDNSTSMCQEQVALAQSFDVFRQRLETSLALDPHIGVTTSDARCDVYADARLGVHASRGVLNGHVTRSFPLGCAETEVKACVADADCGNLDCALLGQHCGEDSAAAGEWGCLRRDKNPECVTNANDSINSVCARRCSEDSECQALFDPSGAASYRCFRVSDAEGRCLRAPDTASTALCPVDEVFAPLDPGNRDPADSPRFLTGADVALFPCIATVGALDAKCIRYEQPISSAWMALDPGGPNANQVRQFLRPDAYLVVVLISDEDDCSDQSSDPDMPKSALVQDADYSRCNLLGTLEDNPPGPLVPVPWYVNRIKSLKRDPSRVIVAAIAGDAVAEMPADVQDLRSDYFEAKRQHPSCHEGTTICSSAQGQAEYGSRLKALTDGFGPNGVFANICSDDIRPALDRIAETIIKVVQRICLPREVAAGGAPMSVVRVKGDGTRVEVRPGSGPGGFQLVPDAPECEVDGERRPSVVLADPIAPGEDVVVTYEGDTSTF